MQVPETAGFHFGLCGGVFRGECRGFQGFQVDNHFCHRGCEAVNQSAPAVCTQISQSPHSLFKVKCTENLIHTSLFATKLQNSNPSI